MAEEAASEPGPSACRSTEMHEEFQFLLCDRCHSKVSHPKLLPCLHNLCSSCLEKKPVDLCAICGTPSFHLAETSEKQDNMFFANLQLNFDLYQKVTGKKESACNNCRAEAEFWCFTCKEFLCLTCFRSHQRYLKKESHEAKPLKDFQLESCEDFLSTIRKSNTMYCSKEGHNIQILSLYCKQCSQPMCTVCTLLDSKHLGQHCDISQEIACKQEELQNMSVELKEKKAAYNETYSRLEELVRNMEQSRNDMKELIQQQIQQMIQLLQEKGKGFLAEIEAHHNHQLQEVNKKMEETDGVAQRITSSQRLVEKLQLYASGQEVLEMYPFLKMSMVDLKKKKPSAVKGIEVRNYLEIKAQLQNLLQRVTKNQEAEPAKAQTKPVKTQTEPQEDLWGRSPLKRQSTEGEANTDSHPKIIKIEPLTEEEWNAATAESYSCLTMDEPGTSYRSSRDRSASGSEGGLNENPDDGLEFADSSSEEDTSMNVSSEEEYTDNETGASVLPLDINPTSPVGQKSPMKSIKSEDLSLESKIIFFDLKALPGNIFHLVALGEDRPPFSIVIYLSRNIGDKVCMLGMTDFLEYLSTLHRPIFVGYKLWSMEIPALLDALQKIDKEEQFENAIFGFLDVLPFFIEKLPENLNYKLKKIDKMYLHGQLDSTNKVEYVRALKDLCTDLEINPETKKEQVIACSSFRCYSSLLPLRKEKVLSRPSIQTLALHNISLSYLRSTYQRDPENGLTRLCRRLNAKRRTGEKKIHRLSKIRTYFKNLPLSS